MHYYYKKYPFLHYNYRDYDGRWTMFSVPPSMLAEVFKERFGYAPKTFFDCGAATGEIVYRARQLGMDARGIDIREYPSQGEHLARLFAEKKIEIKSILDVPPIKSDLAYCNGTLYYLTEQELPRALQKFRDCKMLFAIHNTTEDIEAAEKMGWDLYKEDRLIKSINWWVNTFKENGFDVDYIRKINCFCAMPRTR